MSRIYHISGFYDKNILIIIIGEGDGKHFEIASM